MYRKTPFGSLFLVWLSSVFGLALPPCDPPTIQAEKVAHVDVIQKLVVISAYWG